ncbi:MAG TPA: hypothetical protein VHU83_02640 [Bryobacteraceae bacterium]|jgi:hypothetical protein|nr:hypothetical protein [Bryobacteraceae bacterium]
MKNYSLLVTLVVCCAFGGLMQSPLYAQGRTLTAPQLDAIVNTDLQNCSAQTTQLQSGRIDPASVIPTRNAREFPTDRIAKTLNGVWRGRVIGDDKDTRVDYFEIIDTKLNEALIIAQRTGKETLAKMRPVANAPKLTYLMCAHEGYMPSKDTPQIHEFTKVSDSIEDAPRIMQEATGLKLQKAQPSLSDLWQGLLAEGYFNTPRGTAYAGGFFKPVQIQPVANAVGPAGVSVKWDGEYRGGGSTSIKFTPDVPITGVEHAEFVGTSTNSGDFLVSSPGNGKLWKVEATGPTTRTANTSAASPDIVEGDDYCLAFDKVVLGPLQ